MAEHEMIQIAVLQKPPFGDPCNRCGLCCIQATCFLGKAVFDQKAGPCPALETNGSDYSCGLVNNPAHYAPAQTAVRGEALLSAAARLITGQGMGCDTRNPDEPRNPIYKKFLSDTYRELAPAVLNALSLWVTALDQEEPCKPPPVT